MLLDDMIEEKPPTCGAQRKVVNILLVLRATQSHDTVSARLGKTTTTAIVETTPTTKTTATTTATTTTTTTTVVTRTVATNFVFLDAVAACVFSFFAVVHYLL